MISCAVLDDYQNAATSVADWRVLADKVSVRVFNEHFFDRAELARALSGFEIVVAMRERTPFDAWLFEHLPKLKLLVTTGMRNASIDLDAAARKGVQVCGTGSFGGATSELTWGLIHALTRDIPGEVNRFRQGGKWQTGLGHSLLGKSLGVIGMGNLGERVARVGLAFGMHVSGWSRSLTPLRCAEIGVRHAGTLDDLLRNSDIVTLHVTLNAQSRGLIGAREFGLMRRSAHLVNTSRGPVVDEAALIHALRTGQIAGAAVDVYEEEPLPLDHPFRSLDRLIATPHIGYVTEEGYRVFYGQAVEDISAWLAGTPARILGKS